MGSVITCSHVIKKYADVIAVNDVSLTVEEGEVFGLIGPNGAGKSTLIEMIESLRKPDSGTIRVLGFDPMHESDQLRERIGIQLQTTSIQPNIKVKEAINLFAKLYQKPIDNPLSLLKRLALEDKQDSRFKKLSGGQKQRVAIALAMVNDPAILFFDEISTGLDPQARRNMWQLIKDLHNSSKTIFLTTHYMEEAEMLCDRIAIVDHGKIIALDTPQNLIKNLKADYKILFSTDMMNTDKMDFQELPAVTRTEKGNTDFILYTTDDNVTLQALVRLADEKRFRLNGLRIERPTLDDVFLTLTGKELRE